MTNETSNTQAQETTANLNIWQKLRKIQAELKAPKNLYNSFGKYNYRNAESILEALKPFEERYDVAVLIGDEIVTCGTGRISKENCVYDVPLNYVKATVTFIDCATGKEIKQSAYAREDDHKGMSKDQCTGTASSYARKYALNGMFLLDDTKDNDTDEMHNEREARANNSGAGNNSAGRSGGWGSGRQWGK